MSAASEPIAPAGPPLPTRPGLRAPIAASAAPSRRRGWREPSLLPGFAPAMAFTLLYLSLLVLLPLAALAARPWEHGWQGLWTTLASPRVLAALRLSFGLSFVAAGLNVVMGLVVAWALARYDFPGKRLADAAVDLPFALPTAVAGIALAAIYAPNGWVGALLAPAGIKVAYTPLGVLIALIAVGLPFIVRGVQPVLKDFDAEVEEAALTLGAGPLRRTWQLVLPALTPSLITGFSLAFARAVGEYGSVIFIAGNMPMRSEIAPLLIVIELEQFNYAGAASIGLVMLLLSFAVLITINLVQLAAARRGRR
ncbi:MAG: sulfate ABC transporter permease subunit CysT [Caulobacteraceae bacterium]|nr:sulfate ABC transporter permease subunit CysT [Caulobacteraceae bacterium]